MKIVVLDGPPSPPGPPPPGPPPNENENPCGSGIDFLPFFLLADFVIGNGSSPSLSASLSCSPSLPALGSSSPALVAAALFFFDVFLSGLPKKPSSTNGASASGLSSLLSTSFWSSFFLSDFDGFLSPSFEGGGDEPDEGGVVAADGGWLSDGGVDGGEIGGVSGSAGPPVDGGEIVGSPGRDGVFLVEPPIESPGRLAIDRYDSLYAVGRDVRGEDRDENDRDEDGEANPADGDACVAVGDDRSEIDRDEDVDSLEASRRDVVDEAMRCMWEGGGWGGRWRLRSSAEGSSKLARALACPPVAAPCRFQK